MRTLRHCIGGFFIALDERRVPIAMARASWQLGSWGPFQDAYIEGFAAGSDERTKYGGNDDSHSCGTLKYARIEFAGFKLLNDSELNGLTVTRPSLEDVYLELTEGGLP